MQPLGTARRQSTLQHSSSAYTGHPELQSNPPAKNSRSSERSTGTSDPSHGLGFSGFFWWYLWSASSRDSSPSIIAPLGIHIPPLAWEMLGQQPPKRCPSPAWPCTGSSKGHTPSLWMYISFWHCSVSDSPRLGLQGMFFCTCKKSQKCMGTSWKSAGEKKMKLLLISARRCWVL